MRARRRKYRGGSSKLLKWSLTVVAAVVAVSVMLVLVLRWVPPPTSAFMLQHVLQQRGSSQAVPLRHRWVPLESMSAYAPAAVVAAEDQLFYHHRGFDFEALRQAWAHNQAGGAVRGGSTITQQTAKNLFLWPARSLFRKGVEAYFAVLIEALWPKQRIVEVYLNIAQFGDGIYGVGAASEAFFGKPAAELTAYEAALLAAVLPNPVRLRVDQPSAYVLQRRDWIARQMWQLEAHGYLPSY
ncbi:monofunctional biosynthetic peptidoglycan transglycosylase [Alkalilimnicola ehrlichii]|uniref:Biosynthetic peptidoglycan transglycosylase n=2 Tax=Alkalilimnicola ehrlichii TaxID=351052 RepID=A0A3E0WMI2_9GAMM|nr:monofunctional biosynthetic peptidoglycan transglycosylase [Alkalilimnicola ehrlichii]RFA34162.1 monofunctional biosynthetic peptidoglycan transglycosylase [Alkalilimnicola ehrlichii]